MTVAFVKFNILAILLTVFTSLRMSAGESPGCVLGVM